LKSLLLESPLELLLRRAPSAAGLAVDPVTVSALQKKTLHPSLQRWALVRIRQAGCQYSSTPGSSPAGIAGPRPRHTVHDSVHRQVAIRRQHRSAQQHGRKAPHIAAVSIPHLR
jgi:hypothetical protein